MSMAAAAYVAPEFPPAAATAEHIARVESKLGTFFKLMDMTQAEFDKTPSAKLDLASFFGVPEACVARRKNATVRVKSLRPIFAFRWVSRAKVRVAEYLLNAHVMCEYCYNQSAVSGVLSTNMQVLVAHEASALHAKQVALHSKPRPNTERDEAKMIHAGSGAAQLRILTLLSLISAGGNAAGLSLSSPALHFTPAILTELESMLSDIPSRRTTSKTGPPKDVKHIEVRISSMLRGKKFAIAVRSGFSKLASHGKVMLQIATGPTLPHEMLLGLDYVFSHATAKDQAEMLNGTLKRYHLEASQVTHVLGDVSAVKGATVTELNTEHGWFAEYAHDLPHCLYHVITAFLSPWLEKFGITSHFQHVRAFMEAGGNPTRRMHLFEYALMESGIDFSETRWDGVVRAIIFMASDQSGSELKRAEARLKVLAEAGDDGATVTLGEVDTAPQSHWNTLYEAIHDGDAKYSSKDAYCTSLQASILHYNRNICHFAAFTLLAQLLEPVPPIFKRLQGSAEWACKPSYEDSLDDVDDDMPPPDVEPLKQSPILAAQTLLSRFQLLQIENNCKEFVDGVIATCHKQYEEMLQYSRRSNEGILPGADEFREEDVPKAREAHARILEDTRNQLLDTLNASLTATRACEDMEILLKALQMHEVKERYCLALPLFGCPKSGEEALTFFGLPPVPGSYLQLANCIAEWEHFRWRSTLLPQGVSLCPAEVLQFWQDMADTTPTLSRLAQSFIMCPLSSSSAGRIVSLLADVDMPNTKSVSIKNDMDVLYCQGNSRIVCDLVCEFEREKVRIPERTRREMVADAAARAAMENVIAAALHADIEARAPPRAGAGATESSSACGRGSSDIVELDND